MTPPEFRDFTGRWRLTRRIRDRLAGGDAGFDGIAEFIPKGVDLHYSENGQISLPGQIPLRAERRYLWSETHDGRFAVTFADGRPFHDFDPAWPEAGHICPPDHYHVRYEFSDWPRWNAIWNVEGPRKSYTMTSHYGRPD